MLTMYNMRFKFYFVVILLVFTCNHLYSNTRLNVVIDDGEFWWVGVINHGEVQPLENGYKANLTGYLYGNQGQPLLLSNKGRLVWSEDPFSIEVKYDTIKLSKNEGDFVFKKAANTLKGAYLYASKHFFPPSGAIPAEVMFSHPQYNTWIELLYDQNQDDILKYANNILNNNLPPGVIMIDDNWQEDYGVWKFHTERFPDPGLMMDSLHNMGFVVMLWVCPFISPDSYTGRMLNQKDLLLKTKEGETKIVQWWNGHSSLLDFSNPEAVAWFKKQLDFLQNEYGVDGFKFDAGDPEYYIDSDSYGGITSNEHTELFSKIGLDYGFNEYRATWKMGGQPLAQRLRDKGHSWSDLRMLIPNILLQGIMGYPFTCPDMIGGGEMGSFLDLEKVDQELIVRSAQCHVFMPMMQFSVAPWRVLDEVHLEAVKKAVNLRMQFTDKITEIAKKASINGEPIVRSLEYEFPKGEYEEINNQFMLGADLMVAPFVEKYKSRKVIIPTGKWIDDQNNRYVGPKVIIVENELDRIPFYRKLN
jgi:alpha-glucosidase